MAASEILTDLRRSGCRQSGSLAASSQGIMGTRRLSENDWDGGMSVISPAASPIKLGLEIDGSGVLLMFYRDVSWGLAARNLPSIIPALSWLWWALRGATGIREIAPMADDRIPSLKR